MKLFLKKYAPIFGVSVLTILLVIGLRLIHNIDINLSEIAIYINILANTVILRSIDDIVLVDKLSKIADVHICTDDGTLGFKGNVIEYLKHISHQQHC